MSIKNTWLELSETAEVLHTYIAERLPGFSVAHYMNESKIQIILDAPGARFTITFFNPPAQRNVPRRVNVKIMHEHGINVSILNLWMNDEPKLVENKVISIISTLNCDVIELPVTDYQTEGCV